MATTPPNSFNQAEVAGALSAFYNVASTDSGLVRLLGIVMPDVHAMAQGNPNWKANIPGIIAKYASVAEQFGLGISASQRDAQILNRSNHHSADFASAYGRLEINGGVSAAQLAARAAGNGSERRSSTDFAYAFNGGPYNANNLSNELKSYVGYNNFTARDVAGAANFATSLGVNVNQYAGYFVGSSDTVRNAIQDHIKNGTKLTNEHITSPNDATTIIGAIQSGKIKKEDAPPAIQKLIDDMRAKNIDPTKVDAKAIHQYFKDNPKALDEAKKANEKDIKAKANVSDQQVEIETKNKIATATQKITPPTTKRNEGALGI